MSMHESTTDRDLYQTADPIVEIRDAEVVFEMDRGVSRVLESADLDIERNEILGIVGESGSGKSMLASAMLDAVVEPGILSGQITYHPDERSPSTSSNSTTANSRNSAGRTSRWSSRAR